MCYTYLQICDQLCDEHCIQAHEENQILQQSVQHDLRKYI